MQEFTMVLLFPKPHLVKDEEVYIVGAGNSAGQAAMYLANFAKKVHLLVRGTSVEAKMSQYLVDQINAVDNIDVHLKAQITEVHGNGHLEAITIQSSEEQEKVATGALFIFIGAAPKTNWLQGIVLLDERGFIYTGLETFKEDKPPKTWSLVRKPFLLETSIPGIFAAGGCAAWFG